MDVLGLGSGHEKRRKISPIVFDGFEYRQDVVVAREILTMMKDNQDKTPSLITYAKRTAVYE